MQRSPGAPARPPAVTPWHAYLSSAAGEAAYRNCRLKRGAAFAGQRERILRLFERTRPGAVACVGAGVLNDIPYDAFVDAGATVHLVDWLPGVVDAGIAMSIIRTEADGDPACAYCALADVDARAYCRRFRRPDRSAAKVCERFVPGPGAPATCAAFERAERPIVHVEDATGGYAGAFGRAVEAELPQARSWKQAVGLAAAVAKRVTRHRTSLSVPAGGVQLVTSSMLLSQFEHEPYEYFSKHAVALLGPPKAPEEKRLAPAIERLRSALLANQVARHVDEVRRMLAPGGLCYMSFEMFHIDEGSGRWFLVREMHRALALLAERFHFRFDLLDPAGAVTYYQGEGTPSLVHAFVLEPAAPAGARKKAGPHGPA